jgi:hypothetical protein
MYAGTKLATSTLLSHRVIELLADPSRWNGLPAYMQDWLALQAEVSRLPEPGRLLAETFPRGGQHHLCLYGFAGRNAHQTLGLLVTRRMETAGLHPMGFVANDYALLIWGLDEVPDPAALLEPEDLRNGLEGWLGANAVMKRTFRTAATVAGLIERNLPGLRKTGRQAPSPPTSSTTPSASTTPTTCSSGSPARRPAAASSTSAASRKCSRAAAAESTTSAPPTSPPSPPRSSSKWAASQSRAAPNPASSPKPPTPYSPKPGSAPVVRTRPRGPRSDFARVAR